jgi:hypothetical protein
MLKLLGRWKSVNKLDQQDRNQIYLTDCDPFCSSKDFIGGSKRRNVLDRKGTVRRKAEFRVGL